MLAHRGRGVGLRRRSAPGRRGPGRSLPFLASQRGLSGTKNMPTKNSSDGTAVRANIQRQPVWPYQEVRMNSSVAPAGQIADERTS